MTEALQQQKINNNEKKPYQDGTVCTLMQRSQAGQKNLIRVGQSAQHEKVTGRQKKLIRVGQSAQHAKVTGRPKKNPHQYGRAHIMKRSQEEEEKTSSGWESLHGMQRPQADRKGKKNSFSH